MNTATNVTDQDHLELAPVAVAELRATISGAVLYPGSPGYDELTVGHNTAVRHRPAVIVAATDPADVCAAVTVAAGHDLTVHVQATGHGATTPIIGGLLITTSRLTDIEVDPVAGTVTAGAGTQWSPLTEACAKHGLAPPGMATAGTVGVVGYTLGGGIGPMARAYGFAADHVASIDVVTADGLLRTVDAEHGSDLFWALLGGKFGFGVVTSMTLQLIPAPELFAATVIYAAPDIASALHTYADWAGRTPPALGSTAALMRLPDLPDLPPPLRGQTLLQIEFVVVDGSAVGGSAADGERWLTELVADSTPMMTHSGVTDPAGWLRAHPAPSPMPIWQRGRLLGSLPGEALAAILDVVGPDREVPLFGLEIRCLGGALAGVAGSAENSVGGRAVGFLLNALGAPAPELFAAVVPDLIDRLFDAVEPWSLPGSQINFHGLVDDAHPAASAWPAEIAARLSSIRRRHDPSGVFAGAGA